MRTAWAMHRAIYRVSGGRIGLRSATANHTSMAALVAVAVAHTGERRALALELAAGNDEGSAWPAFIGSLCERGLAGVRLVISDDHRGLVVSPALSSRGDVTELASHLGRLAQLVRALA